MKFIKLTKLKQFENLKAGDQIIVKWWDNWVKHTPYAKKIMTYSIYQNKVEQDEIICKLKGNHYFNWKMYLLNRSSAEEVYLIKEEN